MSTRTDLNAKLDEVLATVAAEAQQVLDALAAAGNPDFDPEIAKLQGIIDAVNAIV